MQLLTLAVGAINFLAFWRCAKPEAWPAMLYPNPEQDHEICGNDGPSRICDPDRILADSERAALKNVIMSIMQISGQRALLCAATQQRAKWEIYVALAERIAVGTGNFKFDGHSGPIEQKDLLSYAHVLRDRYSLNHNCRAYLILLYSRGDRQFYILTGPGTTITSDTVTKVFNQHKMKFVDGRVKEALDRILWAFVTKHLVVKQEIPQFGSEPVLEAPDYSEFKDRSQTVYFPPATEIPEMLTRATEFPFYETENTVENALPESRFYTDRPGDPTEPLLIRNEYVITPPSIHGGSGWRNRLPDWLEPTPPTTPPTIATAAPPEYILPHQSFEDFWTPEEVLSQVNAITIPLHTTAAKNSEREQLSFQTISTLTTEPDWSTAPTRAPVRTVRTEPNELRRSDHIYTENEAQKDSILPSQLSPEFPTLFRNIWAPIGPEVIQTGNSVKSEIASDHSNQLPESYVSFATTTGIPTHQSLSLDTSETQFLEDSEQHVLQVESNPAPQHPKHAYNPTAAPPAHHGASSATVRTFNNYREYLREMGFVDELDNLHAEFSSSTHRPPDVAIERKQETVRKRPKNFERHFAEAEKINNGVSVNLHNSVVFSIAYCLFAMFVLFRNLY